MTDEGAAEMATEPVEGLPRLSIVHVPTLPYSPYQNGKQEKFWGQVEGRLVPMLEGCERLTLAQLNEATLAWAEMEYNRTVHDELKRTPLACYLEDRDVTRPCPATDELRLAFTAEKKRTQRFGDGTISIKTVRFEVPSRYRHLNRICVRYASWDLSYVHMADERTEAILCRIYPLDKHKNVDGKRRRKEPIAAPFAPSPPTGGIAPLLRKHMAEYAATGLPPAYLPKDEIPQ